jgi:hypothetical protein
VRNDILDFFSTPFWSHIPDRPPTFPPSAHTHTKADITDFDHTHLRGDIIDFFASPFWDNIPDKPSTFPPSPHTHVKADITDFDHTHPPSQISPQGSGSGLDADTVDGQHASAFASATHTHSASDIVSGRLSASRLPTSSTANRFLVVRIANADPVYDTIQATDLPAHTHTKSQITDLETITTTPAANAIPKSDASGKIALGWIPQGSGSNLDADKLDGLDSAAFERVSNKGVANGYAPLDANAKVPVTHITDNLRVATVGLTVGDGVNVITTGFKGAIPVPFTGTIIGWTIISNDANPPTTGSIEIDILKSTYADYPTMSSIVGTGTKPNISNSNKSNGTPTNWSTTTINAGDIIGFAVTSVSSLKRITIVLTVLKS